MPDWFGRPLRGLFTSGRSPHARITRDSFAGRRDSVSQAPGEFLSTVRPRFAVQRLSLPRTDRHGFRDSRATVRICHAFATFVPTEFSAECESSRARRTYELE